MINQIKQKYLFLKKTLKNDFRLVKTFGLWDGIMDFLIKIVLRGPFRKIGERLSLYYYKKIQERIQIKPYFKDLIEKYKRGGGSVESLKIGKDAPIWIFWFQGFSEEALPEIVKVCVASVWKNKRSHPLRLITADNYSEFVDLPIYIIEKFKNGAISIQNFSDVLRISLLAVHGGIWMDATLLMTSALPEIIDNSSFYTLRYDLSSTTVSHGKWAVFFMGSSVSHPLICFVRDYLYEYLRQEEMFVCYFLLDIAISTAYDEFEWARNCIDSNFGKGESRLVHLLNLPYNALEYEYVCMTSPLHKLNWRYKPNKDKGTYWEYIKNDVQFSEY